MPVEWLKCQPPDPPILLRRTTGQRRADEAFLDGKWRPTRLIGNYEFGHEDDVDRITEAEARKIAPAAF